MGIRDSNKRVAGLLMAKYQRFSEDKIRFVLLHESRFSGFPKELTNDDVCTIIGNIIENSYEAMKGNPLCIEALCEVFIKSHDEEFELIVHNNGPEIEMSQELIFEKGYTTKGLTHKHSGQGLYLVKGIVEEAKGSIRFENERGVTWYVNIPKQDIHHDC
jgi:two-component system CitB family sensor kinase